MHGLNWRFMNCSLNCWVTVACRRCANVSVVTKVDILPIAPAQKYLKRCPCVVERKQNMHQCIKGVISCVLCEHRW